MSAVPTCVSLAPATPPGDSKLLLTGSADQSVKLWDVQTGRELFSFEHKGPVRCVAWAEGEHEFASISDPFGLALPAAINVFTFADEKDKQSDQPRLVITDKEQPRLKVTRVAWLPLNAALLASYDNGMLRKLDPTTGAVLGEWREHTGSVSSFAMNDEKTLLITSSHDRTAKLWDVTSQACLTTLTHHGGPVQSVLWHPTRPALLATAGYDATIGGGLPLASGATEHLPASAPVGSVTEVDAARAAAGSKTSAHASAQATTKSRAVT